MCLGGQWHNGSLLLTHAPSEKKDVLAKDSFYTELERLLTTITKHYMIMFLGDLNAKVGREVFPDQQEENRAYIK